MTTLKKKSFGKGKRFSKEESSEKKTIEDETLLEKWVVCCFNSKLVADSSQLNVVFSPVTTFSAYIALSIALQREARHSLKSFVFPLDVEEVNNFAGQLKDIPPLNKSEAFFFLRLITDTKNGLVKDKYMSKVRDYFGPYTIVTVAAAEIPAYIFRLTDNQLSIEAARPEKTTGFCPAVVKAKWDGKVGHSTSASFAVGYGKKQTQSFFSLIITASCVSRHGYEAWSIPVITASGRSFTVVLLRPHLTGCLLDLKKQMAASQLADLCGTRRRREKRTLSPAAQLFGHDQR